MRSRYRINEPERPHFITATTVEWLPVFTASGCCDLLVRALCFARERKGLRIYGWVILETYFHAIVAGPALAATIGRSSPRARGSCPLEAGRPPMVSRATGLLSCPVKETERASGVARQRTSPSGGGQEGVHPQSIASDEVMLQKLEYLHNNPVKRGLVASPEHWRYSSAHEWLPGALPVMRVDEWRQVG